MNREKKIIKHVLELANVMGHAPNPEKMTLSEIAKKQNFNAEQTALLVHNVRILDDRGLIVVDKSQNQDATFWTLDRLTWDGHDYLDGLTEKDK
ncbi:DUF2513 domain-containing protein [Pseudomonas protegens]|uniref:DUF2513 domain-containing protein n=1 Tax=Pseudomonas protegens TaxID=380021 RepID=UPI00320BA400